MCTSIVEIARAEAHGEARGKGAVRGLVHVAQEKGVSVSIHQLTCSPRQYWRF